MSDKFTSAQRSIIMSRVKSKDTSPELLIRGIVKRLGYRFKMNVSNLPGKPDIVFPRFKKAILINGCFWHGHKGCKRASLPATNPLFWRNKIEGNISRDGKKQRELRKLGWSLMVIWQCRIKNMNSLNDINANLIYKSNNIISF